MKVLSLREFALMLIKRTEQKMDSVLVTESGSVKGTGKSTFSMLLDREICLILGYLFDIKEIIIFDPTNEKIVDRVRLKPVAWPVHVDEASKVAYKRNWANEEQKRLIIFVNVSRKHYKIINVNNPGFWSLDKDLLNLADFRITILKRGIAIVRGKSKNPETDDNWLRKETDEHIKAHVRDVTDVDAMINSIRNSDNYLFEIHFPEIEKDIYAEYEEMSKEAEMQSFYESQTNLYRQITPALLGLLNFIIARKNLSISSIEITREVNWYLKARNMASSLQPERVRNMMQETNAVGLDERLKEVIGPKLLTDKGVKGRTKTKEVVIAQEKPSQVESVYNKNKNTIENDKTNGGAGAGGLE